MVGKKRKAVLLVLIEAMTDAGSWAGETHVQKCAYFLQAALAVPLELEFLLYKHGPFSFDLHDELEQMVADLIVEYKSQYPYGPSLRAGQTAHRLKESFPRTRKKYRKHVEFVATRISAHDVTWLERAGTALFVSKEQGGTADERARRVNELKRHISVSEAQEAVKQVDKILEDARALVLPISPS